MDWWQLLREQIRNAFSQNCTDFNADGICDGNNTIATSNTDFRALAATPGLFDNCVNLSYAGSYVLKNSINATSTCIGINQSNITLDCRGNTIAMRPQTKVLYLCQHDAQCFDNFLQHHKICCRR